jgi:hypothetical protein
MSLDSDGTLHTMGDVTPADVIATPTGFSFAAPIEYSTDLTDAVTSFVFNFHSEGDLLTVAVPEPAYVNPLLMTLVAGAIYLTISRGWAGRGPRLNG